MNWRGTAHFQGCRSQNDTGSLAALRASARFVAGLVLADASCVISMFTVDSGAAVTVQLTAVSETGPFRLEVTHPAKHIVEYFDTPWDALTRHAELESALSRRAIADVTHVAPAAPSRSRKRRTAVR